MTLINAERPKLKNADDSVRTLVLNADMQPLSWSPLSVWSWQDAITAVMQDRVVMLRAYDDVVVHSPTDTFEVPSIIALKAFYKRKRVAFTRYNVFMRDDFRCQYCGDKSAVRDLTFDHVVPKSKGGISCWTNIVSSCRHDNLKKGSKTLKDARMKLIREPREPSPHEIDAVARKIGPKENLHVTWLDYLYWDSEIEA